MGTTRTASASVRFGGGAATAGWTHVASLAWIGGIVLGLIVLGWFLALHVAQTRRVRA